MIAWMGPRTKSRKSNTKSSKGTLHLSKHGKNGKKWPHAANTHPKHLICIRPGNMNFKAWRRLWEGSQGPETPKKCSKNMVSATLKASYPCQVRNLRRLPNTKNAGYNSSAQMKGRQGLPCVSLIWRGCASSRLGWGNQPQRD